MKLNEMAMAKAHVMVGAVIYIACRIWAGISPASLGFIGNSWFHTRDLSILPGKELTLDMAVLGLISWTIFAGLWGYLIAWAYNWASKK